MVQSILCQHKKGPLPNPSQALPLGEPATAKPRRNRADTYQNCIFSKINLIDTLIL